jgi:hypothetical protein
MPKPSKRGLFEAPLFRAADASRHDLPKLMTSHSVWVTNSSIVDRSAKHRFGWYVEPSYDYSFGRGHEQSLGVSGGLLIAMP